MSDIQRYKFLRYVGRLRPDGIGNYVKYDDHIAEVEKLQARIDELEKALYNPKWERCEARIKAEGIREMLEDVCYGSGASFIEDIEAYADRLEKGDE